MADRNTRGTLARDTGRESVVSGEKNTGLGHDDDGNWDDKRVAGWIMLVLIIGLAVWGAWREVEYAIELVRILIWPSMILMGAAVAEKFKPGAR
jgi:hypothetical protein